MQVDERKYQNPYPHPPPTNNPTHDRLSLFYHFSHYCIYSFTGGAHLPKQDHSETLYPCIGREHTPHLPRQHLHTSTMCTRLIRLDCISQMNEILSSTYIQHICVPLISSDCKLMMAAIEGRNMWFTKLDPILANIPQLCLDCFLTSFYDRGIRNPLQCTLFSRTVCSRQTT